MRVGRPWTTFGRGACVLLLLGVTGCSAASGDEAPERQDSPLAAEASLRPPRAVDSILSLFDQTASVVEGEVTDVRSEYSPRTGPWTVVTLGNVRAHLGAAPRELRLKQAGGVLPDGRQLVVSHVPRFVRGGRYVVFLRNTGWSLSPVLDEHAFRVESVAGREVLVGAEGGLVAGLGSAGVRQTAPVFETVDLMGARPALRAEAQARGAPEGMEREAFLSLLQSHLRARGLAVTGAFREEPVTTASSLSVPVTPAVASPVVPGAVPLQPERDVPPGQP
ncbi:hypothetical protein COCOR_02469 [Corallococcus coralloides DSM 2259]|uniref:Lipoprotein n=1 Tax=Corallococcus coralloides (strain ATCC 25202 / DSM 2259 / NBRC 100086 / M2) TaxID=1144275 RepID=H8MQR9_CORCM|nr:hypothetical protein [Corallococcus coralloides]AFE04660.1 hypothetical protein COCOR_02469 [Corallococcus coralloides DSM 2259]